MFPVLPRPLRGFGCNDLRLVQDAFLFNRFAFLPRSLNTSFTKRVGRVAVEGPFVATVCFVRVPFGSSDQVLMLLFCCHVPSTSL